LGCHRFKNEANDLIKVKYQQRLDTLRFFSVLLVIISHWLPNSEIVRAIPFMGNIGVGFFFVISGYLITSNLIRLKTYSLVDGFKIFYWNRLLRIFPIYYLFLIFFLFYDIEYWNLNAVYFFSYLTNFRIYNVNHWLGLFSHLWSLAIEEQFYLLWPLVILLTSKHRIKHSIIITFLVSLVLKLLTYFSVKSMFIDLLPYSQFDLFMFGAFLSLYKDKITHVIVSLSLIKNLLIFTMLCLLGYFTGTFYLIKNISLGLISVYLILSINLNYAINKVADIKPLIFLGKISYGLYLYHNFIPLFERNIVGSEVKNKFMDSVLPNLESPIYHLFLQTILLLTLSITSWYFIEKPILKLKKTNY
jgi:peptidoglycan/LPS O-acetylase OafA/YrhL